MTDQFIDPRDYSKDRVAHVGFPEALTKAANGWVIARSAWPNGQIVFLAKEGTFVAKDLVTGVLEQFLVLRRVDGVYEPYVPSQNDIGGIDWACITRQTFQRQMPTNRPAAAQRNVPDTPVEWKDYPTPRSEGS